MKELLADLGELDLHLGIFEIPRFSDEPKFPSFFVSPAKRAPYTDPRPYGMCLAEDELTARAKALAEFYERVCVYNPIGLYSPNRWTPETGWLDPAVFEQDPERAKELRAAHYIWLDARSFHTSRETKVPAQLVIPAFDRDELRILPEIGTSGLALGRKGDGGAVRRGLMEAVERQINGQAGFSECVSRRVVDLHPRAVALQHSLLRYGIETYVFWGQAAHHTPWIMAASVDRSGVGPALSYATRAAESFEAAIEAALLESIERRRPARIEDASRSPETEESRTYPWNTLEDLAWVEPEFHAAEMTPLAGLPKQDRTANELLSAFAADGDEVLVVDLTLPEVAAAGFEAVKVMVPSLGPMPA